MKPMWPVALVASMILNCVSLANAAEPKASGTKQIITNSIGMKLTLVPSGEFMMGSSESADDTAAFFNKFYGKHLLKTDAFEDEHPQHRVRVTRSFYLGTYHVTRGQFRQFVNGTGYKTDSEKAEPKDALGLSLDKNERNSDEKYSWRNPGSEQTDEHPVICVSWNDAVAFCQWLTRKEGKTYRLPTEAEWEYACRAGTATRYSSGDDPETLAKVGNVWTRKYTIVAGAKYVLTTPVGSFQPNAFGLYDMHGNAWQWCSDWYDEKYYAVSPVDNPTGPDAGAFRVLRGGSWGSRPDLARSASRYLWPSGQSNARGFRVARTN